MNTVFYTPSKRKNKTYDLVICGGGLHGSILFINLPKHVQNNTLIIDNNSHPLAQFFSQCKTVGISHLRSPASHCMHKNFNSLFEYAVKHNFSQKHFEGRYYTPTIDLFYDYCTHSLKTCKIQNSWLKAHIESLEYKNKLWSITTSKEVLQTKRVILALGGEKAAIPTYCKNATNISHILDIPFIDPPDGSKIAIIGAGMSGVQSALRFYTDKHCRVTVFSHKDISVNFFDSNPCFIGPKCLPLFLSEKDYNKRRNIIQTHRFSGTINSFCMNIFSNAVKKNHISYIIGKIENIFQRKNTNTIQLQKNSTKHAIPKSTTEEFNSVIFASGFEKSIPPHNHIIAPLKSKYSLATTQGGWPIVDSSLQWHSGLYLTGALAELELGPAARNIIGAHLAYRRLENEWKYW